MRTYSLFTFIVSALLVTQVQATTTDTTRISEQGNFRVTYESNTNPIPLNEMHHWIVTLHSMSGVVVPNAIIAVSGGMPLHNHGLPTAPRVTQELAPGRYLLEGVKFQMGGHWTVNLKITSGNVTDSVTFDLTL